MATTIVHLCERHGPFYVKGCEDCARDMDMLAGIEPPDGDDDPRPTPEGAP